MAIPDFGGVPVLVTGGAGFIGSHLVDALVECGARVRVLDDLSTGIRSNLGGVSGKIELVEGDIRDVAVCRSACEGVNIVFHEAALGSVPRSMKDPATTIAVNVAGTSNIFAAARDESVGTIVFASSSSIYGDSERLPKREGEEGRPLSPYALSKSVNEQMAECFARAFSARIVGLRYFNVYGPRQSPEGPYAAVIPKFLQAAGTGGRLTIYGDGEQERDFTFVSDAVQANLLAAAASRELAGRCFNIASGTGTSIGRLARLILEMPGAAGEIVHAAPRPGDVRQSRADLAKSKRDLGFEPAVPIEEGLRRTVEAYRVEAT
jgi:nucleoside-diphosphate-sugar epimerase